MAMACLNPVLSSRLTYSQPLASSQSGRYGRAALRSCSLPTASPSSSRLACAAVGHGGWRLAAAVEPQAVQEEEEEQARTEGSGEAGAVGTAEASSKLVLVVGGTGGVGQLVVASLLSRNIKSRLLLRNPEKAVPLFGKQAESLLQVYKADTRSTDDLDPEMFEGSLFIGSYTCDLLYWNYSISFKALGWG